MVSATKYRSKRLPWFRQTPNERTLRRIYNGVNSAIDDVIAEYGRSSRPTTATGGPTRASVVRSRQHLGSLRSNLRPHQSVWVDAVTEAYINQPRPPGGKPRAHLTDEMARVLQKAYADHQEKSRLPRFFSREGYHLIQISQRLGIPISEETLHSISDVVAQMRRNPELKKMPEPDRIKLIQGYMRAYMKAKRNFFKYHGIKENVVYPAYEGLLDNLAGALKFSSPALTNPRSLIVAKNALIRPGLTNMPRYDLTTPIEIGFFSQFARPIKGAAGSKIGLIDLHGGGDFDLAIRDRGGDLLGWFGLSLNPRRKTIRIHTIQGRVFAEDSQASFQRSSGTHWADHIAQQLMPICQKAGIEEMLLIDPRRQGHTSKSESPKTTRAMYYTVKNKLKFRRRNSRWYARKVPKAA